MGRGGKPKTQSFVLWGPTPRFFQNKKNKAGRKPPRARFASGAPPICYFSQKKWGKAPPNPLFAGPPGGGNSRRRGAKTFWRFLGGGKKTCFFWLAFGGKKKGGGGIMVVRRAGHPLGGPQEAKNLNGKGGNGGFFQEAKPNTFLVSDLSNAREFTKIFGGAPGGRVTRELRQWPPLRTQGADFSGKQGKTRFFLRGGEGPPPQQTGGGASFFRGGDGGGGPGGRVRGAGGFFSKISRGRPISFRDKGGVFG